jgi:hypothetical protein
LAHLADKIYVFFFKKKTEQTEKHQTGQNGTEAGSKQRAYESVAQ